MNKIKIFWLLVAALILSAYISTSLNKDNDPVYLPKGETYNALWVKIDSLMEIKQPKSALKLVNKIYTQAKQKHEYQQIVKSVVYKIKIQNETEENSSVKSIKLLEQEINTSKFPEKNIFQSMLGQMYFQFYKKNRWRFANRSNGIDSDDINTWSITKIINTAEKYYLKSLSQTDSLQRTPLKYFDVLVENGNLPEYITPTLFDFLSQRAFNFFKNNGISVNNTKDMIFFSDNAYFSDIELFADAIFKNNDTLSIHFNAIRVLQNQIKFHQKTGNVQALANLDLQRLKFIYDNTVNPQKDSLYTNALLNVLKYTKNKAVSGAVYYDLGIFYKKKGAKYNPDSPATYKYKKFNKIAEKYFNAGAEGFEKTLWAENCKAQIKYLKQKQFSFLAEKNVLPDENFPIQLKYKNIENLDINIYKFSYKKYFNNDNYYNKIRLKKLIEKTEQVYHKKIKLPKQNDFNFHTSDIVIPKLNKGLYLIKIDSKQDSLSVYQFVNVSNLCLVSNSENNIAEGYIQNRKSGDYIQKVKIDVFSSDYDFRSNNTSMRYITSKFTDKKGYFQLPPQKRGYYTYSLIISHKSDTLLNKRIDVNNYRDNEYTYFKDFIFTDKAIYRPGQIVYFKVLSIKSKNKNNEIIPNKKITVKLYNTNYKSIAEKNLETNEFGTCSGFFRLPESTLNGLFTIQTSKGSYQIRVEEYKKPKFTASFSKINKQFKINDTIDISINAKTFYGVPLNNATVNYKIVRTTHAWYYYHKKEKIIAVGNSTFNHKGIANIKFKAIPDKENSNIYSYTVYADITDINGETHQISKTINVAKNDLFLSSNIKDKLILEKFDTIKINTFNVNNQNVNSNGEIKIYKLKSAKYLKHTLWNTPDTALYSMNEWYSLLPNTEYKGESKLKNLPVEKEVFKQNFTSDQAVIINKENFSPGIYKATIVCTDSIGNKITENKYFTLYSVNNKKLPTNKVFDVCAVKTNCKPSENAEIIIASSQKIKVFYELKQKNKVFERKIIDLNNNQKTINIPVTEDYRGGVSVYFSTIYDNRMFAYNKRISVPYDNKQLKINFISFRDKLLPGQKEKWQIKITGNNAEKVNAELLASMYDKSLDKLRANTWNLSIWNNYYTYNTWENNVSELVNSYSLYRHSYYPHIKNISYPKLQWFGYNFYSYGYLRYKGASFAGAEMEAPLPSKSAERQKSQEKTLSDNSREKNPDNQLKNSTNDKSDIKIRKNFKETAFFYPDLTTDENGNISFEFTMPDALTTWKFMGLAITKDLKTAYIEKEVITQKQLMVDVNTPRFFRENDTVYIPLKISNLTSNIVSAKYNLDISFIKNDGSTQNISLKNDKLVNIKPNESTVFFKKIVIPDNTSLLKYTFSAIGNRHTDAEQNIIPVLSNKIFITETMPMQLQSKQTKTFVFNHLKNSKPGNIDNFKYTIEFTSNPVWYAVKALPYLMKYPNECSEQTFSRFYSNTLAENIISKFPKIRTVLDKWRMTDSKSFLSELYKNQELKNIIIEETPWVNNAQDETSQRKNIALLFDINKMSHEQTKAIDKLENLQYPNGAWPWFSGMPADRFITQYIIEGIGRLYHLHALNKTYKIDAMIDKAIKYADNKLLEDYNYIMNHYDYEEINKKQISSIQLQYLYARSFFVEKKLDEKIIPAYNYFLSQAAKYWTKTSIYNQALTSLVLYRTNNQPLTAKLIVKSLKQRALTDENGAMYWKNNNSGYYWYTLPIQTQSTLIELFEEVAKDKESVDKMKIWLLNQKHTQHWATTKATTEAIYAVLLSGNKTDLETANPVIAIAKQKLQINKVEAGTGYFKKTWSANDITPELAEITVKNKNKNIAWGAAYWQYFENIDEIKNSKTDLSIEKQIFLIDEQNVNKKITEQTNLKLGDKITVKLIIRSKRNMDYVHIKDLRASGLEPDNVFSKYNYSSGLSYYISTKDAATHIFINHLNKGTYVIEYKLTATHKGAFSNGIASIECMYAPEFKSNTGSQKINIE